MSWAPTFRYQIGYNMGIEGIIVIVLQLVHGGLHRSSNS